MQTPILGQAYMLRSPNAADNRLVNLYPEIIVEGGKQAAYLTRAPGLRRLATLGDGPVRGLWQTGSYGYAVSGNTFYRIDSSWNATAIGPVAGFGPVSMADNGLQIFIAANPYGYVYDIQANTIAQINDPDFPGAVTVGFIDGYFIFNEPNSQRFWITDLYQGENIDALDFASAEGSPDGLVAVAVDHREAWLFGTNSVEVWYDSGASDFPFERIQGAYNEIGCVAAYSVAKLDNGLFWLGADARGRGIVYRANGYTGQRISTHAVEWAIQQYSDISDAIGYTYQQDGHAFYVLIFPTARTTWVYDVATQAWHERAGWENGEFVRHRSNCQMSFADEIVVGDYNSGKIYAFDKSVYDDDGDIQKWLRSWRALPTGQNDLKRTAQHSLQLDVSSGTATVEDTPSITPIPWPVDPSTWVVGYHPMGFSFSPYLWGITLDAERNVLLSSNKNVAFLSKISTTGVVQWTKTYQNSADYFGKTRFTTVAYANPNFIGTSYVSNSGTLFSFTGDGTLNWAKTLNKNDGGTQSEFFNVAVVNGKIYAVGSLASGLGWYTNIILEVTTSGTLSRYWQMNKPTGWSMDDFRGFSYVGGHMFVVSDEYGGGTRRVRITKVNPSSTTTPFWSVVATGGSDTYGTVITNDAAGNSYVIVRDSASYGVLSLDPNGVQRWCVAFKNNLGNFVAPNTLTVRSDGILVVGMTYVTNSPNVLFINPDTGAIIKSRTVGQSGANTTTVQAMVYDGSNFYYNAAFFGFGTGQNNSFELVGKLSYDLSTTGSWAFPDGTQFNISNTYSLTPEAKTVTVVSNSIAWVTAYPPSFSTTSVFTLTNFTQASDKISVGA